MSVFQPEVLLEVSSFVELLRVRAKEQGSREIYYFLRDGEQDQVSISYAELDQQALAIGAWLQSVGASGERVLLLFPAGLEYLAAFFGCLYAGAIAVPAYPPSSSRMTSRLQAILEDAGVKVALTTSSVYKKIQSFVSNSFQIPNFQWLLTEQMPLHMEDHWQAPDIGRNTLAFLQYTSGSTSTPKGVMVTHRNLLHNSLLIHQSFQTGTNDHGVVWLPPYHDMGLIGGLLQPLAIGFSVTLISPTDFMQRPLRWLEAISRTKATISGAPNFAYELAVEKSTPEQRAALDLSNWHLAFNGAEPIRATTQDKFAEAFAVSGFRKETFFPCYGLAEATLLVSGTKLSSTTTRLFSVAALEQNRVVEVDTPDKGQDVRTLVSCGRVAGDQDVRSVHLETGQECTASEVGEIWVAGSSVTHGYWSRREQTEETFRAYLPNGEGPFLRTGDLGFLYDGQLYITGRLKDLIIIRGRNHYPQDIELTAENSHPALRKGANAAFSLQVDSEERLFLAQEVNRHQHAINVEEIASAIREAVAEEHGVQVYAVLLLRFASIPKTSSGKIQRHACRDGYLNKTLTVIGTDILETLGEEDNNYLLMEQAPPSHAELIALPEEERLSKLERYLRQQTAHIVKLSPAHLQASQSLNSLGLDSLAAIQLLHQIETDLGVVLEPSLLLKGSALSELAEDISAQLQNGQAALGTAPVGGREIGEYAMSRGQQGIWFLYKLSPNSAAYNVSRAFTLEGELDLEALHKALQGLVDRHAILRTTFFERDGKPMQRVSARSTVSLQWEDATAWSEETLKVRLHAEATGPFELEYDQLMRAHLFKRSEQRYVMLWSFHHIVIDYWSLDVLFGDLETLYADAKRGRTSRLPSSPPSFSSYVAWQLSWLNSEEGKRKLTYWQRQLSGELPTLDLPTDRPRPLRQSLHGATMQMRIHKDMTRRLRELSQTQGVTLYNTLLTAYSVLMYRYTGQEDLIIGSYMAGRTRAEFAPLIGYLTNAVPLRFDLSGTPTFIELLLRVRQATLGAFAHQDYPFDLLVEKLQPERDPSRSPIFQAAFVMQNVGVHNKRLAPLTVGCDQVSVNLDDLMLRAIPLEENVSLFDLTVTVAELDGELVTNFQYSTDLFDASTIQRMTGHWQTLLADLTAKPQQPIMSAQLLTAAEQAQLALWNQRQAEFRVELSLPQIFEYQAEKHRDEVAAVYGEQSLTYAELNRRANQVAHYLRACGVGPEVLVGISMERSLDLIVGILGICKAGGAYVPLDPNYPTMRLQYMLEDSRASIVLTQEHLLGKLPESGASMICLDRDWKHIAQMDDANPTGVLTPDNLAYVIYTSGSTGNPKGVLVSHHNVVRLFKATDAWFRFNEQDVWTMFHSYAFDFSVWEMWGALLYGSRLVVVPYWISRTPAEFHRLLVKEKVTVLNQTPSAFRQLARADELSHESGELALRYVIFGGEALEIQSLKPWFARHGDTRPRLINMYGITETTVHVTYRSLSMDDLNRQSSVIGRAIPDLEVHILDCHLQPVPLGVKGEMFVGGAGVARGYLNHPDLTAERFLEIPSEKEGTCLYRTGDLARYLPNGDIEYLGRIDHQIKIRGFRIELGEIDAILAQHPNVHEEVVLVREDLPGDKKLVAYVVTIDSTLPPSVTELRSYMAERLPDYMVPSAFILMDALPVTANGKMDHKALPTPDIFAMERTEYVPPATPEENTIAVIWEQVLGVRPIGIDDNFFLLGGDSIRSIRVSSRAKEKGIDLTLEQIFRHQTIRELARAVKRNEGVEGDVQSLPPFALIPEEDRLKLPADVEDAYPVPAIQMSYYFHSESSEVYKAYLGTYRLRGPFNEEAFNEAFRLMVKRHEILRTSFDMSNYSMPLQLVHKTAAIKLNVIDLRHLTLTEQDAYLKEFIYLQERKRFDWKTPGLIRFHAHRLTDEVFQFTMCEPFLDGWSAATMITEVFTTYLQVLRDPNTLEVPKLKAKFNRFVALELQTKESRESQAYWEKTLSDVSTTRLPRWKGGEGATSQTDKNDRLLVPISQEVTEGLLHLSRTTSVPLKDVVLAAHLKVVSLLSGQTDIVTGVVSGGRPDEEDAERVLGAMVNTMPFRMDVTGGTWEDLVRRTFEIERESFPHRRFPLVDLQKKYSGGQHLFETIFNYTHFHVYQSVTASGDIEVLDGWHRESAYVPLTVQFSVDPMSSQLMCVLDYYPEDLCFEQVTYIAHYFTKTLEGMATNPTVPHEAQCLLGEEELHRLLVENTQKTAGYPLDQCFHELFVQQVARTPHHKAIVHKEEHITYEELDIHSNRLAHHLWKLGVKPGMFVGYFGARNIDWAIAVIAIFKAGAVYIPLDPKYPFDRLSYMIEHSNMSVLLTYENLMDKVPREGLQIVYLDRDRAAIAQANTEPLLNMVTPDDLAYMIYTSGSTGLPKGAMIEHKGMVNHLYAKMEALGAKAYDIIAQNASQCFDVSVWQLLLALLVGGQTTILPDEAEADPELLLQEIERARVTIFETVPTVLQALLESIMLNEATRPTFAPMRWLVVSGEILPPELCRQWFHYYPYVPMINACGATETSDDVTHQYILQAPGPDVKFMPIGKVIPNCSLYVLDHALQPVPIGVPGELCCGGICIGRGYLNDPEKTESVFKSDPFSKKPGARLYKTGDLVRIHNDGSIEFLGRLDNQIKIRGFRIELGELEAVLSKHPDVIQVVAMVHTDERGNKRLVAYLTLVKGAMLSSTELREYMKKHVPGHLVPSFFMILDEFPMTLNGKVDRKKLPTLMLAQSEKEYIAPRTEVERVVADLWGQVLCYEYTSMTDDFFESGGDSLLATRLISLIRKHFAIELPLRTLFEVVTIEGLAGVVQSQIDLSQDNELKGLFEDLEDLPLEEALFLLKGDGEE